VLLVTDVRRAPATAAIGRATVPGLVAVVAAVLAFSISGSFVKWSEQTGAVIAFWRMVGAIGAWWTVLLVAHLRNGVALPDRRTWRLVLPAGVFFGANISLFFTVITKTSIAHAEFIGSLSPLLVVPAGAVFFGEQPNWGALRFGVVSIAGVAIVLAFGSSNGVATVGGDLLMFVVVGTWVSYLLFARRARAAGVETITFMACLMPLGLLSATPIALTAGGSELFSVSARGWFVVALLVLLTGMVAHGCITFAQRHVPVAMISIMQIAQPALAVMWAFIILGETVRPLQVVGMALVICGLALFTRTSQRMR
jgi:drug/metabolite transporter (DMT)-like permease